MRWKLVMMSLMLAVSLPVRGQDYDRIEALMKVMGADSEEEADAQEVERLEGLLARPLRINQMSYSAMMESGLFSHYQIVSLTDYRKHHGDILSISELSAVDGFGASLARLLAPFISLDSDTSPGSVSRPDDKIENDLLCKGAFKVSGASASQWNYGLKYKVSVNGKLTAAAAVSRPYSGTAAFLPQISTGHLSWRFRRYSAMLLIGNFNARFAQGLAMCSGMSLSGLSGLSSFSRRASGISPSWSFSGTSSLTGIAGKFSLHQLDVSVFTALPGIRGKNPFSELLPGINMSYNMDNIRVGLTHYALFSGIAGPSPRIPDMKSSADFRSCFGGTDFWGEITFDWVSSSTAALLGSSFLSGENMRMAVLLRMYPSDFTSSYSAAARAGTKSSNEYGMAAAGEWTAGGYVKIRGREGFGASVPKHNGSFSFDLVYFPSTKSAAVSRSIQFKGRLMWKQMLSDALSMDLRMNTRLRNWEKHVSKIELRSELAWMPGKMRVSARLNTQICASIGLLGYMEAGYKGDRLSVYFRQGIFRIDNWDDRIYVYERDAPGNFSVPAYYGRGVWEALTLSWRLTKVGRLYFRAASTTYPFMPEEKKKPGKAELKLQYVLSF